MVYLPITNEGMMVCRSCPVKTIAFHGELTTCQSVQDAISAAALPCRCLVDDCST